MRALTVIPMKCGTAEVREVPDPEPNDDEAVERAPEALRHDAAQIKQVVEVCP
jgi:hypothetical protein